MTPFSLLIKKELNPAQAEAALSEEGPLLIVAGAGAGKTKTIAYRIVHLLEKGIPPENILAITFTNKAAEEMRERVTKLAGEHGHYIRERGSLFLGTFHSLGVQILREHAQTLGISKNFAILDRSESLSRTKEALRQAGFDPKEFEPKKILGVISREKGNLARPEDFVGGDNDFFMDVVGRTWTIYEKILKEEGSLDFDDLMVLPVRLLSAHPAILDTYQERFKYIHIDEYQDTSTAQYELARMLSAKYKNICVVGDSDQSVYGWRGADFRNILNFEKDYPGTKVVRLEENYRSTKNIIAAAQGVIEKNHLRHDKKLFTNNASGELITLYQAFDEDDEARYVAEEAEEALRSGIPAYEIALLYRANFQSRALEEAFLSRNIPYQVLGTRFFERKEVKDILAYIRAALYKEDLASFLRIVNVPPRGLGKVALAKIAAGREELLPARAQASLLELRESLEKIKVSSSILKPSETVTLALSESKITSVLSKKSDADIDRLENIRELITLAKKYDRFPSEEGLERLLIESALLSDQDNLSRGEGGVKLLTVHAAKGLEFNTVFITGLEEGLFPHARPEESAANQEEERRLFYVALTRAKKKLYLTLARSRTLFGGRDYRLPSSFLEDIDPSLVFEIQKDSPGRVIYLD